MRSLLLLRDERDAAAEADVLVIDARDWGTARTATFLARPRQRPVFVRLGPLDRDGLADDLLDELVPARPDALVLAGTASGHDVERLSALLRPRETRAGLPDRSLPVIAALAGPAVFLHLDTFRDAGERLAGLIADTGALPAGARGHAEAGALLAAAACGVPAYRVDQGDDLAATRRAGFTGVLTDDPARLPAIANAFATDGNR